MHYTCHYYLANTLRCTLFFAESEKEARDKVLFHFPLAQNIVCLPQVELPPVAKHFARAATFAFALLLMCASVADAASVRYCTHGIGPTHTHSNWHAKHVHK